MHKTKQIGLFTRTYDSFSNRQDEKLSAQMKHLLVSEFSNNKIHLVCPKNLQDDTNEGMRTAFYKHHENSPLSAILGVRVIDKHNSVIYTNKSSAGSTLYAPLQKTIFPLPLDNKSVTIENDFVGSASKSIRNEVLESWAEKKSIVQPPAYPLNDSWEHDVGRFLNELKEVLNAPYKEKKADARKRHELNCLLNQMADAGYVEQGHAKFLKASRERIREFSEKDQVDSLRAALRLISNAVGEASEKYKKTLGIELPDILLNLINDMVEDQLRPPPVSNALNQQMPLVTKVLNTDPSIAHIPIFYVPTCAETETPKCATFLPCVDIELTVEAAGRIIHSKAYQGLFKKAIEDWAKKL